MIKIKDIPAGSIVWKKSTIVGVKDATLDKRYFEYGCIELDGNYFDYEIVYNGTLKNLKKEIEEKGK